MTPKPDTDFTAAQELATAAVRQGAVAPKHGGRVLSPEEKRFFCTPSGEREPSPETPVLDRTAAVVPYTPPRVDIEPDKIFGRNADAPEQRRPSPEEIARILAGLRTGELPRPV